MKFIYAAIVALLSALAFTVSATAGEGHDPIAICHMPGTPAEMTLIVDDNSTQLEGHLQHGDYIGECDSMPPDACPDMDGYQESVSQCEDEEDYCATLPGVQAEDEDCPGPPGPPPVTPPSPPSNPPCTFIVADKDGGKDAYGGTNDDCAPRPTDPKTTTTVSTLGTTIVYVDRIVTPPIREITKTVTKVKTKVKTRVIVKYKVKVKKVYIKVKAKHEKCPPYTKRYKGVCAPMGNG